MFHVVKFKSFIKAPLLLCLLDVLRMELGMVGEGGCVGWEGGLRFWLRRFNLCFVLLVF